MPRPAVGEKEYLMSMTPEQTGLVDQDRRLPRTIPVTINNQTVQLPEQEMTGLEIKQAAAAQGLPIDAGFQLSVKHGGRYDVVGDTDTVRIHPNLEFLAVAPDDNS